MLGTDYPFPLGELEPGFLIESMDDLGSLKVIRSLKKCITIGNTSYYLLFLSLGEITL